MKRIGMVELQSGNESGAVILSREDGRFGIFFGEGAYSNAVAFARAYELKRREKAGEPPHDFRIIVCHDGLVRVYENLSTDSVCFRNLEEAVEYMKDAVAPIAIKAKLNAEESAEGNCMVYDSKGNTVARFYGDDAWKNAILLVNQSACS